MIFFSQNVIFFSLFFWACVCFFFINKQTRDGRTPNESDFGLTVIKTQEDSNTGKILKSIYDNMTPLAGALNESVDIIEQTMFKELLMNIPSIFFNIPVELTDDGVKEEEAMVITQYPSFTYLPKGGAPEMNAGFAILDTTQGYSKNNIKLNLIN
jgi:hypothetical protein